MEPPWMPDDLPSNRQRVVGATMLPGVAWMVGADAKNSASGLLLSKVQGKLKG
jgi:hypothetical protein